MDKRNKANDGTYTAAIFDEIGSADVCLCLEGCTRVIKVIARIYDASANRFKVVR